MDIEVSSLTRQELEHHLVNEHGGSITGGTILEVQEEHRQRHAVEQRAMVYGAHHTHPDLESRYSADQSRDDHGRFGEGGGGSGKPNEGKFQTGGFSGGTKGKSGRYDLTPQGDGTYDVHHSGASGSPAGFVQREQAPKGSANWGQPLKTWTASGWDRSHGQAKIVDVSKGHSSREAAAEAVIAWDKARDPMVRYADHGREANPPE